MKSFCKSATLGCILVVGCSLGLPAARSQDVASVVHRVSQHSFHPLNDLIALQQEFEDLNVNVATIECHDQYRTRLMVGKEADAEYINWPSTIIIDPEGIVRLAYRGTFWGDRPSIHETLEMIKNEQFEYAHPRRLKMSERDPNPDSQ